MVSLSTAFDNLNSLTLGENQNIEYGWFNNFDKLIVQFNFQLIRCNLHELEVLKKKFNLLIKKIFTENPNIDEIKILYKLIGHTRDIIAGKGEYTLTYMMISELYKFTLSNECPENQKIKIQSLITNFIETLVLNINGETHPYGSWKDLKYLCNYHVPQEQRNKYYVNSANDIIINK